MAEIKLDTKYVNPRFYLGKGQELKERLGWGISGATAKADRERKVGTTKTVKRWGGKVGKTTVIWDGKKWIKGSTLPKKTVTTDEKNPWLNPQNTDLLKIGFGNPLFSGQTITEKVQSDRRNKQIWKGPGLGFTDPSQYGINVKTELGPTQAPDPQKGTDQINTGSGNFRTWRVENKDNQPLQKAFQEKNQTTTTKPTPTTSASKLKISSDVHTIDPSTGEPVGVLTRSQRRAFEAREDVQQQLLEAQKNKKDLRIYKNKTAGG